MKIIGIILVFVIVGSLVCNFFIVYAMFSLKEDFKSNIEAIAPPLYERVAERFAEVHEYNNNASEGIIYNCINYSNDLSFILKNLGYDAKKITITTKDPNKLHAIINLTLQIEPQSATVLIRK